MPSEAGKRAEDAALRFLEGKGLKLVERNYRTPLGEIDLVMRDGDTWVFVEVRYRSNPRFGGAIESIGRVKQRRLVQSALLYLQGCGEAARHPSRFDAVVMQPGDIRWIRDAFRP